MLQVVKLNEVCCISRSDKFGQGRASSDRLRRKVERGDRFNEHADWPTTAITSNDNNNNALITTGRLRPIVSRPIAHVSSLTQYNNSDIIIILVVLECGYHAVRIHPSVRPSVCFAVPRLALFPCGRQRADILPRHQALVIVTRPAAIVVCYGARQLLQHIISIECRAAATQPCLVMSLLVTRHESSQPIGEASKSINQSINQSINESAKWQRWQSSRLIDCYSMSMQFNLDQSDPIHFSRFQSDLIQSDSVG